MMMQNSLRYVHYVIYVYSYYYNSVSKLCNKIVKVKELHVRTYIFIPNILSVQKYRKVL